MPRWWESEPRDIYAKRQGRAFRASAERRVFRLAARDELRSRGLDANTFPQLSTPQGPLITGAQADEIQPDTKSQGGSRGILGSIVGAVDDVSSAVFRGKVREPWDTLRPLKQLMDWSYSNVNIPIARTYTKEAGKLGGSLQEAIGYKGVDLPFGLGTTKNLYGLLPPEGTPERAQKIDELQNIEIQAGAMSVFDPLTWTGLGGAGVVAKYGAKAAARLPVLDALFSGVGSRTALKTVLTGDTTQLLGGLRLPKAFEVSEVSTGRFLDKSGPIQISVSRHPEDASLIVADLMHEGTPSPTNLRYVAARLQDVLESNPQLKGIRSRVINTKLVSLLRRLGLSGDDITSPITGRVLGAEFNIGVNDLSRLSGREWRIGGGAGESPEMERILTGIQGTKLDTFGVKSTAEVIEDARQNLSFSQFSRRIIGRSLPSSITRWVEERGLRLIDDDVGMLLNEYGRIKALGHSAAARSNDLIRASTKGAFQIDNEGRVLNFADRPYIDDLAENYLDYKLTTQQMGSIRVVNEQLGILRELEKASGLKIRDIPTPRGIYVHRQVIRRPVNIIDPKSLEQLEEAVPVGPAIKERLGAKQAFEKPRTVSTKLEGVASGVTYMPFADAQQARIVQGYNRVADKWLEAALKPYGFSPTALLAKEAPELLSQGVTLAQRVRHLQSLEREVTIAKRVGSRYAFRMPGKLIDDDVVLLANQAKDASGLPKKVGRQAVLADIQDEVRGLLKQTRAELGPIKARRTTLMRQLTASGTREFPKSFRSKFYSEQVGERLLEFDSPGPSGLLEKTVNRFNSLTRPLMATLDASFMGVQGLVGAAHNPKAYMQALRYAFTTAYDERVAAHQASGLLDTFIKSGGHWAARNDIGEFLFPSFVERVPGIGRAAKTSNTWFTRFGNGLRLEMFDSAAKLGQHSAKELEGLARMTNLATGYTGSKATSIETAMLFAPRFFRSQLGLVSDAFTKRTLGGNQAASAIAKLIISGTALTYTLNEVLGNKTEFNPSSPNFLRIRALNRDISVFGPWDSLVRAIYTGSTNPIQGASYIARTKASPAVARIYDLIQGHTIQGTELKWGNAEEVMESLGTLAQQVAPISSQQALEKGIPTTPEELGAAAIQFGGTKASPLTAYEQLNNRRNEASQEMFREDWSDLEPQQRFELESTRPELKRPAASSEIGKAFEAQRALLETFEVQQRALDSAGMSGPEWRAEYQRINAARAGAFDQWEREHPEAAGYRQVPDNPNDLALKQNRDAFKEAQNPWGGIDPERLALRLTELEDSWTPEQKAYVERNTGFRNTPLVKEYKRAVKTLRPYFELEDQIWDTVRQNSPELSPYNTTDDYVFSIVQGLVRQGYPIEQAATIASELPVISQIEAIVSDLRERYRFANPDADAALAKWFGATPIYLQRRGRHKRRFR